MPWVIVVGHQWLYLCRTPDRLDPMDRGLTRVRLALSFQPALPRQRNWGRPRDVCSRSVRSRTSTRAAVTCQGTINTIARVTGDPGSIRLDRLRGTRCGRGCQRMSGCTGEYPERAHRRPDQPSRSRCGQAGRPLPVVPHSVHRARAGRNRVTSHGRFTGFQWGVRAHGTVGVVARQ